MSKGWAILFVIGLVVVIVGVGVGVGLQADKITDAFLPALTAALVWVTAFYTIATAKIMETSEKQAKSAVNAQHNSAAPVVKLKASKGSTTGGNIEVIYSNIGNGPALNFRCWIDDDEYPALKQKRITSTALPVTLNSQNTNSILTEIPHYSLGIGYIRAQYESIFGISYESRLMFPANTKPQLEYGKAEEIIEL